LFGQSWAKSDACVIIRALDAVPDDHTRFHARPRQTRSLEVVRLLAWFFAILLESAS